MLSETGEVEAGSANNRGGNAVCSLLTVQSCERRRFCVHRTCGGLDQDRESSTTHFVFLISYFSGFPVPYSAQSVDEKDGG